MLWRQCCDTTNKIHVENRNSLIPKIIEYKNKISEIINTEIDSIIKE